MTITESTIRHSEIREILADYDRRVRANTDETWDALAIVAVCEDGYHGALGEVLDVSRPWLQVRHETEWDSTSLVLLAVAFAQYQRDLRVEVGEERLAAARVDGTY